MNSSMTTPTILSLFGTVIIGAITGALVRYLADVLPGRRVWGKLSCPHATTTSTVKWMFLGERCKECGVNEPWRFWGTVAFYAAASGALYWFGIRHISYGYALLLLFYLGVVFWIDVEYRAILHETSLFGALYCFYLGWLQHGILNTLIGLLIGVGFFGLFYLIGILFMKIMSRIRKMTIEETALGFGDMILAGILGSVLGYPIIIPGLLLAILMAGGFALMILIIQKANKRYQEFTAFAYGPFLIIASIVMLILQK